MEDLSQLLAKSANFSVELVLKGSYVNIHEIVLEFVPRLGQLVNRLDNLGVRDIEEGGLYGSDLSNARGVTMGQLDHITDCLLIVEAQLLLEDWVVLTQDAHVA